MCKKEEQCYLAGYNGKKLPPWVPSYAKGLKMAYKAEQADRKAGKPLEYKNKIEDNHGKARQGT